MKTNRKWLGGLALGIALSKFSVVIPFVIFLAYKRQWTPIVVGLVIQVIAFSALAVLRPGSPHEVFVDFVSIAASHASFEGVHLTGLFSVTTTTAILVGIVFSVTVFTPLWFHLSMTKAWDSPSAVHDYTVFAVLCLWGLLVAYHRGYDIFLALPALVLLLHALSSPASWSIGSSQIKWLVALFLVSVVVMSIPARFIEDVVGSWWGHFVRGSITVDLLLLLAASMLFSRQLAHVYLRRTELARAQ
jgi:hypothetical protein